MPSADKLNKSNKSPGNDRIHAVDDIMQHSSYYHKRYEGYMEKLATDVNGRKHIERVYTGEYYSQDITDKRHFLTRILYAVLYLLAAGLFLFASSTSTVSNLAVYVQLICFIILAAMFVMLVYLITYIASPRRMTVWEHYSGPVRVKQWSQMTAILMAIEALAVATFVILHRDIELSGELINIAGYLAASLAVISINRIEAKIAYKKTLSESEPPRGGYCIDN